MGGATRVMRWRGRWGSCAALLLCVAELPRAAAEPPPATGAIQGQRAGDILAGRGAEQHRLAGLQDVLQLRVAPRSVRGAIRTLGQEATRVEDIGGASSEHEP